MGKQIKKRPGPGRKMTSRRMERFIDKLSHTGLVGIACKHAGVSRSTYLRERERNHVFALRCDEALEDYADLCAYTLAQRGIEGDDVPVFQAGKRVMDYDGTPATIRKRDTKALQTELRRLRPLDYAEKKQVSIDGEIAHKIDRGAYIQITADDVEMMTIDQRDSLGELMKVIKRNRDKPAVIEHTKYGWLEVPAHLLAASIDVEDNTNDDG